MAAVHRTNISPSSSQFSSLSEQISRPVLLGKILLYKLYNFSENFIENQFKNFSCDSFSPVFLFEGCPTTLRGFPPFCSKSHVIQRHANHMPGLHNNVPKILKGKPVHRPTSLHLSRKFGKVIKFLLVTRFDFPRVFPSVGNFLGHEFFSPHLLEVVQEFFFYLSNKL